MCLPFICFGFLYPPPLPLSPLMWTLINSSQGQMGRRMQALFSPPLKLPSGGNIITFINNSGGFTVSISWFRHFWIRNKKPYRCNHKSFDLSFSWDKREMITAQDPPRSPFPILLPSPTPTEGLTLISTTNYSRLRLHLPRKLTFIATRLQIKSISQLPSRHVIGLGMVNKAVSAILLRGPEAFQHTS